MSLFQTPFISSNAAALFNVFKDLRVQLDKVPIYEPCKSIITTRKKLEILFQHLLHSISV